MPQTPAPAADVTSRALPVQTRAAELVPATFDEAANTVDVVWTQGARIRRYDYWNDTPYEEELVVDVEAIDMVRFDAGTVQVLDGHQVHGGVAAILGVAVRGWIEGGEGRATIRLSQRPELAGVVSDIRAGIIRSISFGYSVQRYEITRAQDRTDGINLPLYRAARWTPQEISFVTVPADPGASTRSQPTPSPQEGRTGTPCEFVRAAAHSPQESTMPQQATTEPGGNTAAPETRHAPGAPGAPSAVAQAAAAVAAAPAGPGLDATRSADISDLCTRHGVGHLASGLIRGNSSVDAARTAVLEELARRDSAGGGHRNVRVETVTDEQQTRSAGIAEALLHRVDAGTTLTDNGRQFRGMHLVEIGREMIEATGQNTRGMSRLELATRMLQVRSTGYQGTSDFGALLSNVASRRMRTAYEQSATTYQIWARRAPNAPDFKEISVVQLSGAPELMQTNEHGEFTYGTLKDGAETYKVLTYGRIVALTRQAIINDDMRGFDRLITAFGDSARRLENRLVYAQLTSNPVMADGKTLFHADHGNLAGAGSALDDVEALGAGRKDMRLQKGMQGELLNIAPRYLIAPASLEQLVYQFTSANYTPTTAAGVNEFRAGGRTALEPVIEPLLDAASTTAWYLAANAGQIDTVEYAYLDGAEGPVIESEQGFEVDGVSIKARLDFAAKAVDWRGLRKATGAA